MINLKRDKNTLKDMIQKKEKIKSIMWLLLGAIISLLMPVLFT